MSIDRNARARVRALILAHAPEAGAMALGVLLLDKFMSVRTGECWPSYDTLAKLLHTSKSKISKWLQQLQAAGILLIARRWERRRTYRAGRWVPARVPNLYTFKALVPACAPSAAPKYRSGTGTDSNRSPIVAELPAGLAAVLERLGNAIAERNEKGCGTADMRR